MSTAIEWTDETWNPVTGCTKVSTGCKNCYAERLAPKVFAGQKIGDMRGGPLRPRVFTDVLVHHDRLDAPLHWKKPRRIFVNSMSDLFHEEVQPLFIGSVLGIAAACEQHTFQVLTKRPQRMLEVLASSDFLNAFEESSDMYTHTEHRWPVDNVWLGVSVEDQPTADERIPLLLQTPAAVRFLSCEPLLGPISLTRISLGKAPMRIGATEFRETEFTINALKGAQSLNWPSIDWCIAGGESGPNARPAHPDWFRSLRDQCAAAGVPFFFKQFGEWAPSGSGHSFVCACGEYTPWLASGWHQHCRASHACVAKVGKKAAGRTLDGRIHDEYPA